MGKTVFFRFGRQIIKLCADNPDYLKDVASLLEAFQEEGGDKETTTFRVVLPSETTSEDDAVYLIYQDEEEVFKTKDPFRVVFRLEWLIVKTLLKGVDYLEFHSAVVSKNGEAALFPAVSNSGKTSLAVALWRKGFQCYSDEVALIDPKSLRAYPFPRNIHVEPEMEELFSGQGHLLKFKELKWKDLEGKNLDMEIKKNKGGMKKKSSRVKFIIFPKYSSDHANQLKSITAGEAFARLLGNEINFRLFQGKGMDIVEGLVKNARCYELKTGDLDEAVHRIQDLFDSKKAVA